MLLQTNSYIVPKDKRTQHARLVQRFRQTLTRLGCDHFEAYEQVGSNWSPADTTGRFVQLMRFRDRKHQLAVQGAERNDSTAQALIKEFCELINFPYQQQQGLFAVGFYHSLLPSIMPRTERASSTEFASAPAPDPVADAFAGGGLGNGEIERDEEPVLDPVEEPIERGESRAHGGAIGEAVGGSALSLVADDADFERFEGEISDNETLMDEMESSSGPTDSHTAQPDDLE